MSDTSYPALVGFVTLALGLAPGLWPEQFRRWPYRIAAIICAIVLGLGTYAVMEHDRRTAEHTAAVDREDAIQKTSARVAASTSASVADALGRQFAETVAEVRGMRKDTVASTARIRALWEKTKNGDQKRQEIRDRLNGYAGAGGLILGGCGQVSPPGRGGTSPQVCINGGRSWVEGTTGYIAGSLGELYVDRFMPAGLPGNSPVAPDTTGIDSNLDSYTAGQVHSAMHELQAKIAVLKEFIRELEKPKP